MCPARVECQSGQRFILKAGEELGKTSIFFDELAFKEKSDLKGWLSIYGTDNGFKIALWGRVDRFIFVSPTRIASCPAGLKNDIQFEEGNVYRLREGTKIVPLRSCEVKK